MSKFGVYKFHSLIEILTSKFKSFRKFLVLLTTDLKLLAYFAMFIQRTKYF